MVVYRNYTPTIEQIKKLGMMRITTVQEATAFLRMIQPQLEQCAYMLQKKTLIEQRQINKSLNPAPEPAPAPEPVVEPPKTFEAEDLSTEEGYSEADTKEKVNKLKKANGKQRSEKEGN